jgi:hypothetical protein
MSGSGESPLTVAEQAVMSVMQDEGERSWTLSELAARLADASGETPVSVRRLAIQRLLAAGRLVMGDDRAVTLSHGLGRASGH